MNPASEAIRHRNKILERQTPPVRPLLLYGSQVIKPKMRKLFPPIEGIFRNIERERISNARKDCLVEFALRYVVAERMLIAEFIEAILVEGYADAMARLQAVQSAAKC